MKSRIKTGINLGKLMWQNEPLGTTFPPAGSKHCLQDVVSKNCRSFTTKNLVLIMIFGALPFSFEVGFDHKLPGLKGNICSVGHFSTSF